MSSTTLPPRLAELVDDFEAVGPNDRLQLLLELSRELPELPARFAGRREAMEQVHECQSPLFLAVELDDGEPADGGLIGGEDATVRLYFDAPQESPTTRGFASIMYTGLDGEAAGEILAVPNDFYLRLGLAEAVSPLRLRGMAAMLARIKRLVRDQRA